MSLDNLPTVPDLDGPGDQDAYWQRMKINAAIRHLRDIEDYYRPSGDNVFAQARANRVRDIYEQLSEDYLNGRLNRPTMAERVKIAEDALTRIALAAQEASLRVVQSGSGIVFADVAMRDWDRVREVALAGLPKPSQEP